jgi:hypothetical protein
VCHVEAFRFRRLGDRDPRVLLAVPEAAAVVLATLELLHVELGTLDVLLDARW